MATAYEKLVRHFVDRELRYSEHEERRTVTADFRGEVGSFRLMSRIDDDDSLLQVFVYIPIRATPGSRAAIAEAVSRANFGMKVGKFELDMSDGELLFQAAHILVPDSEGETFLPDQVIGRVIGTALAMVDKYTPAFLSIIYGNETPSDAIRCVESPSPASIEESLRSLLGDSSSDSSDGSSDGSSESDGDGDSDEDEDSDEDDASGGNLSSDDFTEINDDGDSSADMKSDDDVGMNLDDLDLGLNDDGSNGGQQGGRH